MEPFATTLVAITAVTICGICVFIFVCALQPRFLRKLHSKANRTHRGTDPNTASNDDELSVRSLDPSMESRRTTIDNSSSPPDGKNRDKKAYLKSLERSLRTGRQIKDENDDDDQSHSIPSKYIRHCLNKYIRRTGRNSLETTEL